MRKHVDMPANKIVEPCLNCGHAIWCHHNHHLATRCVHSVPDHKGTQNCPCAGWVALYDHKMSELIGVKP